MNYNSLNLDWRNERFIRLSIKNGYEMYPLLFEKYKFLCVVSIMYTYVYA